MKANLLVAVFAVGLTIILCEVGLRWVPSLLPAGTYGAGRFDRELGMNVHATPVIYNKVRLTRRIPNDDGFMDVDHDVQAEPGVTRVAFFGDSYVESAQVPLEQVFFRRLAERMGSGEFEFFGFGVSGWGTFAAMRAYDVLGTRYGIGVAIYVFVENDLGDQVDLISKGSASIPRLRVTDAPPGYEPVWPADPDQRGWAQRFAKAVQTRSLLAQVLISRLGILRAYGPQLTRARSDVEMSRAAREVPDPNDLPSTWAPEFRQMAETLGEQILADWSQLTRSRGQTFAVLYVPRGEAQLRGEIAEAGTWLPWLRRTCAKFSIPLIDPSPELRARLERGNRVYDDHWSAAGHEAIADAVETFLIGQRGAWSTEDEPRQRVAPLAPGETQRSSGGLHRGAHDHVSPRSEVSPPIAN